MRRALVPFVIAIAIASGVAADPATARADGAQRVRDVAVTVAGEARTYRVVAPSASAPGAPLIVALHGLYGSGPQFERASGWDATARAAGAVVVYPTSYEAGWRSGAAATADVAFLARMIADVVRAERADRDRVYVTGHSSGAFMTYRFACERPQLVAAIGPVAGAPLADCADPDVPPIPVVAVHGTADTTVPYAGGIPNVPGIATTQPVPSALETITRWVQRDGCAPTPVTRAQAGVVRQTWGHCDGGASVRLISIVDWPHRYPTTAAGAPIDATAELWSVLRRQR